MNWWNRKIIITITIILGGVFFLTSNFTAPLTSPEPNVDKLTDYLYSAPVIIKRLKAFFSFSELPIFEVTNKQVATAHNQEPQKPRAQALPTPTASPIAAKPKVKSSDKTAEDNTNTNGRPKFVVETVNNKNNDEPAKEYAEPESPKDIGTAPNVVNKVEQDLNDWKYRLFMNPSKDNMNTFIQEYLLGKITKEIFYGVLKSLINESDDRAQAIAIYGLSAVTSFESYEILAIKIDDRSLLKENQALAQKNIDYYSGPENMNILLVALKSSREVVTLQALHNINQLIERNQLHAQTQSQNVTSLSDREKRGSASTQLKKDSYYQFVDALQGLAHDANSQIAILAENTLQEFQTAISPRPNYEVSNIQTASRIR